MISRAFVAAFALLVTGCGGGGGSSSAPTPTNHPTTASLTLTIPAATSQSIGRKPQYVSPYTTAIQIVISNVNGSPTVPPGFAASTTINLTTGSGGNCSAATGGGETCTVNVPAPAGDIVYTFTILNAKGQALATATKLLTITKGESNNLAVVLGGVVAKVTILVPTILASVPSIGTLVVDAYDASGGLIDATAPYAVPIVLTDTDQTLSTHLEVRNGIGPTAQVNTASDVVTFAYDGNPDVPPFEINATVGTTQVGTTGPIAPATSVIAFSNTYIDTGAKGDLNYEQPTIFFATIGATTTTTASESGYGGTFTATLDPGTCLTASGPVATLTGSPGTTFSVASLNPGVCKVIVDDTIGHTSIFWISVTTGVVTINSHAHRIVK
jgi:hypothetical protein